MALTGPGPPQEACCSLLGPWPAWGARQRPRAGFPGWFGPSLRWTARAGTPLLLLRLTLKALILALDLEGPDSVLQGIHCPGFSCDAPAGRHRYVGSLHGSRSGDQDGWRAAWRGWEWGGVQGSTPCPSRTQGSLKARALVGGCRLPEFAVSTGSLDSKSLCPRSHRTCSQLICESESGV